MWFTESQSFSVLAETTCNTVDVKKMKERQLML